MEIHFKFINACKMRIEACRSVLNELDDRLTFFAKGYQFSPKYKRGLWDGQIRLLNAAQGTTYVGLFKHIYDLCRASGYTVTVDARLKDILKKEKFNPEEFVKSIKLPEDRQPRDYQVESLRLVGNYYRRVIVSPTASGKSLTIYMTLRMILEENPDAHIMLIVPTQKLVDQMISDFRDYSCDNGWNVDDYCYPIYAGKEKFQNKNIAVSTWQTAMGFSKERFSTVDAVLVDEVHLAPGKCIRGIIDSCINAVYRAGYTGSLDESETNEITLTGMFGPVTEVATSVELMERGQMAALSISALKLVYRRDTKIEVAAMNYQDEISFLVNCWQRTNFIAKLASRLKGNAIILATQVEHCGSIYDNLKQIAPFKKIFLMTGQIAEGPDLGVKKSEYMEAMRKYIDNNDDCIVVATYGLMSTGTNIPRLHSAIFASPYKSKVKVIQSIGRILRLGRDKRFATLYDIADDFSYKRRKNTTLKHFEERCRLYSEQGFPYSVKEIEINA